MEKLRTIEVDFDVHKCIESERRSFDESANTALRRLLRLPEYKDEAKPFVLDSGGLPWTEDGVALPHGTIVRLSYDRGRQTYEGKIVNGKWVFGNAIYDSPSGAASDLARTKKGKKTNLNGWNYCEFKESSIGKWVSLKELRNKKKPVPTLEELGL